MSGVRRSEDWLAEFNAGRTKSGASAAAKPKTAAADAVQPVARSRSDKQTGRLKGPSEDEIQKSVARYLDLVLPDPCRWFHVPNGGLRDPATAGQLKAAGAKAGAPDVLVLWGNRWIWIELKTEIGRLSAAQEAWRRWIHSIGGDWFLCRSVEDVHVALAGLGIDLRGRVV